MTATSTTRRKKGTKPLPPWFGWNQHVVPTWQLTPFFEKYRPQWQSMYTPLQHLTVEKSVTQNMAEDNGWLSVIATRVGLITGKTEAAVARRLYDYTHAKTEIVGAEFVDAMCLSLGLHLEYDCGFTILPGNRRDAEEMIRLRGANMKQEPNEDEVRKMAHDLLHVAASIIKEPERFEALLAKAPLNVLGGAK